MRGGVRGGGRGVPEDSGGGSLLVSRHEGDSPVKAEGGVLQVLEDVQVEQPVWLRL